MILAFKQETTGQPVICKCRKCQARYEPAEFQSHYYCSDCMQPVAAGCMHGISLLDMCQSCIGLYGSPHMRLRATPQKAPRKKITLTRMKPIK